MLRRELESNSIEATDHRGSTLKAFGISPSSQSNSDKAKHDCRNQLNKATLGLHLAQKQLAAGQIESADKTLVSALARLSELESSATVTSAPKSKQVGLKAFVAESRRSTEHGPNGLATAGPGGAEWFVPFCLPFCLSLFVAFSTKWWKNALKYLASVLP